MARHVYAPQLEISLNASRPSAPAQSRTLRGAADPLDIILRASKNEEHVALLELHNNSIHVASYLKKLLLKAKLKQRKLHGAVRHARARLPKVVHRR